VRIALVHDWLAEMGEPEKFFLRLLELFPGADLFTLVYQPDQVDPVFKNRKITASALQRFPFGKALYPYFIPFYWGLMRGFNLSDYDLVVSSSSACAKWIKTPKKAIHVCYFHGPMANLWDEEKGEAEPFFPPWELKLFRNYLRRCDLKSNEGITHFLTESDDMKALVQRLYGREAEVIPPPWDARFLFRTQVYFRRIFGIATIPDNNKF
jgi:hypothetical protein